MHLKEVMIIAGAILSLFSNCVFKRNLKETHQICFQFYTRQNVPEMEYFKHIFFYVMVQVNPILKARISSQVWLLIK